jgi:HK97 family phage major capsid protein
MPRRRTSDELSTLMEAQRAIILEVDGLEEPTEEDLTRSAGALDAFEELEVERADAVEYEDRMEAVRSADLARANEPGDQRNGGHIERTQRRTPEVMNRVDPFEILRSNNGHMDKREITRALVDSNLKALDGLDVQDRGRESFERYIKRHGRDTSWATNLLARMTPEYIGAFEKITVGQAVLLDEAERAAIAVGTNTAGGYLVPTHLDPTLIITNTGAKDVVRTISRVVSLTGGANKWNGVSTAGSTASWDAELTEVSDDTPPFAPVQIPVFSAKSLLQASIESFEDISALGSDVQMLLADSRTRLEAAAHVSGNGTSAPTGIVTALDANTNVEISLTTGHTWTLADLQRVAIALGDRWTDDAEWLINPLFLGEIQALGTALGATYSTDLTQPFTQSLLGHKVNQSFTMPAVSQTTTVDNLLVFGSFTNYVIVDKPGSTSIEFIPHLFNTSNNLPDGRRAWYMHFRNGADSVNDLAFRLLQDKTTA